MHSTCFARGMRSTAFPWAVVLLSAIWSGVHPVEVTVPSTSYISTKGDDARALFDAAANGSDDDEWEEDVEMA